MTSFEKLESLPDAEHYLKPGVALEGLEKQANAMTDLEALEALHKARRRLFALIEKESP